MVKPSVAEFPKSMSALEWTWEEADPDNGLAVHEVEYEIERAIAPVLERVKVHYADIEERIFRTVTHQLKSDIEGHGLSAGNGDGWFVGILFFEACFVEFKSVDVIDDIARACSENAEDKECKEQIASRLEAAAKVIRESM